MSYQGYANYETWAVSLWLNNCQGDWVHWSDRAVDLVDEHEGDKDAATADLAAEIKAAIEDYNPLSEQASLYSDLITHAMGAVDYREVADGFVEDIEYTPEDGAYL